MGHQISPITAVAKIDAAHPEPARGLRPTMYRSPLRSWGPMNYAGREHSDVVEYRNT